MANSAITLQSGIHEYNGDLTQYTGMLGGLTPDVHTLRSLNPETTNRVICVMYRGPYFLMKYFNAFNSYGPDSPFWTYKKVIEYYNMGIQCNIQDQQLGTVQIQGGFAGRTIPIATTQNAQQGQSLTITVPELVGRPIANVHNMWVNGIADQITGLTTYHGLVAGSQDENNVLQPVFSTGPTGSGEGTGEALEPSPAWEVAEFLIIALDRSGARVEAAIAALGCIPAAQVGSDIFNHTNTGQSALQQIQLQFNCQFVQSTYINDLAARYVNQFAIFGNSLNFNPGAGDAFFRNAQDLSNQQIDTKMFNDGNRPTLDAVQSAAGNYPAFRAQGNFDQREGLRDVNVTPFKHTHIYSGKQIDQTEGSWTNISDGYTERMNAINNPTSG